jgi:DNA-binding NarL/FixJ family response regulator
MIRLLVVADSGAAMAAITGTLRAISSVDIVAYASGIAPVRRVVEASRPDVVIVDEMRRPGLALTRIEEIRAAMPEAAVLALSGEDDPERVVAGLRAGAAAVVPRRLPAATLARVLQDVTAGSPAPMAERTAA